MKKFRISLLGWVGIAILSGILLGQVFPDAVSRFFVTFNSDVCSSDLLLF